MSVLTKLVKLLFLPFVVLDRLLRPITNAAQRLRPELVTKLAVSLFLIVAIPATKLRAFFSR